jgi:uncharacterized protein
MDNGTRARYEKLKQHLKMYGRASIAFSGGLSSAFLLRTAQDILGTQNVLAITVLSRSVPEEERLRAQALIRDWGIQQVFVENDFWRDAAKYNSDRYKAYCRDLFENVLKIASERGFDLVLSGSAADDPDARFEMNGSAAMLIQPLVQAGLKKEHLRDIALFEGWTIYDVPHNSDLITRFSNGREITAIDLERVERAETILRNLGFNMVRVRDHGDLARVEIDPEEWERLNSPKLRELICIGLKKLGYSYTTIDMRGYRPNSMNECHDNHNE